MPQFVCMRALMAAYKVCTHTECVLCILVVPGFPGKAGKPLDFIMMLVHECSYHVDLFPPSGAQVP